MDRSLGRRGEERAARWLEGKGWRIVKKNFRTRRGEVDIIGEDGPDLVFVEVKSWQTLGRSSLEYGIDQKKRRRIAQAARLFLRQHPDYEDRRIRFDVVLIRRLDREPELVENAFETEWDE